MICTDCSFRAPFEQFVARGGVLECRKCNGRSVASDGQSNQLVGADTTSPYEQTAFVASESDVRSAKEELKRFEDSTNLAINNCQGSIPAAELRGWDDFRTEFYRFYIAKEGAGLPYILAPVQNALALREQMAQAEKYRTELQNWQTRLAPYCGGTVGPSIAELKPQDPGILDRLSQAEKDAKDTAAQFAKYALWGGIALAAIFAFVAIKNLPASQALAAKAFDKMPVIP